MAPQSTPASSSPGAVTISIVSHGQMAMVLPLMEQLDALSCSHIAKVVLTENIPESDLVTALSPRFAIERIFNGAPKGFGANHNQAFERCTSPWFLVLNPDIRLDVDVLAPLLARASPTSGLLTPRIVEPDRATPEPHRRIITPLEILRRRRPDYSHPEIPEWIPGLFMLYRSNVYAEIGGFNQKRFFMYGEDFDICARMQLAGWRIQVEEDLRIQHAAQRASHGSGRHLYWHVTSLLKVWTSQTFWRYRRLSGR